jgi:hypothetical protein
MLNTFIKRGIAPNRVWAQSFNQPDIFQWVKEYPEFAKQAVYLDGDGDTAATSITATARLRTLKTKRREYHLPFLRLSSHHHRRQQDHNPQRMRN